MGKRILFISAQPTHPLTSGDRIRQKALMDLLAGLGHEVHFLFAAREANDAEAMRAWLGDRFHLAAYKMRGRKESVATKWLRRASQIVDRDARYLWGIDDWYDPNLDQVIDRLHSIHRFETVVVKYAYLSRAFERFGPGVLKVLDAQDRLVYKHREYLNAGVEPRFFSTTQNEETRGVNRADLVLAIQDEDRKSFSRICEREVITVGHVVAVEPQFGADRPREGFNLLFVGSVSHLNVAAIGAFVRDVWPELRRRIPDARLLLAGKVCDSDVGGAGVERLGYVEDARSVYRRADVVVNPVPHGTGLPIKSIEALGYGVPLVTYPGGARGLEAAIDRALITAGTPGDMVAAIERLHNEPDRGRALSTAALEFAREWNATALAQLVAKLG